jgi:hypothetical protein
MSETSETFAARVALYGDWDRRMRARTRFFAAAALINAALLELCSHHLLLGTAYASGIDFLARLGGYLQAFNIAIANGIERGRWDGVCPDRSLVTLEQAAAEKVLKQFSRYDERAHRRVIRQIDRLLYCLGHARSSGLVGCSPSVALLRQGVRIARSRAGSGVSFAAMRDRVAIGEALIRLLRNSELECGQPLRGAFPAGGLNMIETFGDEYE